MKQDKIMKNFLLSFDKKQRKKFIEKLILMDKDIERIDEIKYQETQKYINEDKS